MKKKSKSIPPLLSCSNDIDVYKRQDREDAEPLSSYVANCTLDATPGGLYVEAAQEEALDTALSNAGFGICLLYTSQLRRFPYGCRG